MRQDAPPKRKGLRRFFVWCLRLAVVAGLLGAGALLWFLDASGRAPREWAIALNQSPIGRHDTVTEPSGLFTRALLLADRGRLPAQTALPAWAGARAGVRTDGPAPLRTRRVASPGELVAAVAEAQPGDHILLAPGTYRLTQTLGLAGRPGRADAPITLGGARFDAVVLESPSVAAIKISSPWWRIEHLTIRGVCAMDWACEHAFHIVGAAHDTLIQNVWLEDFNAQIKINGEAGVFPDRGTIRHTTMTNSRPRYSRNPVTPIDLVAASDWTISDNLITDFVRDGPGGASYGAFAKGAGSGVVFERNVILCEARLRGLAGQRIGLSLGGGSTEPAFCRDEVCAAEHRGGVIRDNLIAQCSDVGIYINRAAQSRIAHNTLIDTAGIDIRFPDSTAEVDGNIIDGTLRTRDGATLRDLGNAVPSRLGLFVGLHPQRDLFADALAGDYGWRGPPPRAQAPAATRDLCGTTRPDPPAMGAFEQIAPCLARAAK